MMEARNGVQYTPKLFSTCDCCERKKDLKWTSVIRARSMRKLTILGDWREGNETGAMSVRKKTHREFVVARNVSAESQEREEERDNVENVF